jgi:hypothetical protein
MLVHQRADQFLKTVLLLALSSVLLSACSGSSKVDGDTYYGSVDVSAATTHEETLDHVIDLDCVSAATGECRADIGAEEIDIKGLQGALEDQRVGGVARKDVLVVVEDIAALLVADRSLGNAPRTGFASLLSNQESAFQDLDSDLDQLQVDAPTYLSPFPWGLLIIVPSAVLGLAITIAGAWAWLERKPAPPSGGSGAGTPGAKEDTAAAQDVRVTIEEATVAALVELGTLLIEGTAYLRQRRRDRLASYALIIGPAIAAAGVIVAAILSRK